MCFDVIRYFDHHKYSYLDATPLTNIEIHKLTKNFPYVMLPYFEEIHYKYDYTKTLFCGLKSSDGLQTWKNDEKLWISRHGFLLNIFGKRLEPCVIYVAT